MIKVTKFHTFYLDVEEDEVPFLVERDFGVVTINSIKIIKLGTSSSRTGQ